MNLRPSARLASIGCALMMGVAACGSSSSSGTGGAGGGIVPTGGTTGTAGTSGGAGGTTGTAGGSIGTAGASGVGGTSGGVGGASGVVSCGDLPACIASVVAACPLVSSSCVVSAVVAGNTDTHYICLGDGVKASNATTNDLDTGAGSTSISVSKGGAPCYTLDGTFNAQDPLSTPRLLSFKDASGMELATFSTNFMASTVTVTCAGSAAAVPITNFGNCGMPNNPEPDQCVGGGACMPTP